MAMTFVEWVVVLGAATGIVYSLYSENITVFFRQKGITRMCSKNAQKNVTIYDADSGISYIGVNDQHVRDEVYLCELYPLGEKHHPIKIEIDFSLVRSSGIGLFRTGSCTLNIVRRENLSVVFEANNSLFDEAPEVLYDRLRRLESDKIRMEAEIVELKAMKHQDVKNVIDTAKSLEMAKGQGRGGVQR